VPPLTWSVDTGPATTPATVDGAPCPASIAALQRCLAGHLSRRSVPLLVSLSALSTTDPELFSIIAAITGPEAPSMAVVLQSGDDSDARRHRSGIPQPRIPLSRALTTARAALLGHPTDQSHSDHLLPLPGAARRSRNVATDACLRSNLPHLIATAAPVAGELITYVSRRASSMMKLSTFTSPTSMYLAVQHGCYPALSPDEASKPDPTTALGLHVINAVATHWGFPTPRPGHHHGGRHHPRTGRSHRPLFRRDAIRLVADQR
jgi:hypothetical protein